MEIELTKKDRRNRLTCVRADGSRTTADVGPGLPFHDLAHFIVETRLELRHGFFGNVASGYSLEALADKAVIRTLGAETWLAETLARALGALATGATTPEQFSDLVNTDLAALHMAPLESLRARLATEMLTDFKALIGRYEAVPNGGSLRLEFI